MKAIAINDIPLFEGSDIFRATVGMEYECEIKGDNVQLRNSSGKFQLEITLGRFNMIFIEKNEFLRQKRQSKLERIMK